MWTHPPNHITQMLAHEVAHLSPLHSHSLVTTFHSLSPKGRHFLFLNSVDKPRELPTTHPPYAGPTRHAFPRIPIKFSIQGVALPSCLAFPSALYSMTASSSDPIVTIFKDFLAERYQKLFKKLYLCAYLPAVDPKTHSLLILFPLPTP